MESFCQLYYLFSEVSDYTCNYSFLGTDLFKNHHNFSIWPHTKERTCYTKGPMKWSRGQWCPKRYLWYSYNDVWTMSLISLIRGLKSSHTENVKAKGEGRAMKAERHAERRRWTRKKSREKPHYGENTRISCGKSNKAEPLWTAGPLQWRNNWAMSNRHVLLVGVGMALCGAVECSLLELLLYIQWCSASPAGLALHFHTGKMYKRQRFSLLLPRYATITERTWVCCL